MGCIVYSRYIHPIIIGWIFGHIYNYINVGLSALLVSINWAMRRPYIVERVTDWLHVFLCTKNLTNNITPAMESADRKFYKADAWIL